MLTDIFASRYATVRIGEDFGDSEHRLLNQCVRILSEQLFPHFSRGHHHIERPFWQDTESRVSMELGVVGLGPGGRVASDKSDIRDWLLADLRDRASADRHMKERMGFIELALRKIEQGVVSANANIARDLKQRRRDEFRSKAWIHRKFNKEFHERIDAHNLQFKSSVSELNARFRQASSNLQYHNGFIQRATDDLTASVLDTPFCSIVSDPKWRNVDHDMKEAMDHRENGSEDAAFFSARALESTIKIIATERMLTSGKENGAVAHIENLKRGAVIQAWEAEALKLFFLKFGIRSATGRDHTLN